MLLLALAILGNQLAVGWSNDYLDRETDRQHQRDKPIVAGRLSPRPLGTATLFALFISITCGALLGPLALTYLLIGTAAGLSYNLGLKDTRLSWLPYVVAFSVLPFFAWAALDVFRPGLLWLLPIALPLAPVAHVANALPDIAADTDAGRRGLAVALGRPASLIFVGLGLALPVLLLALSLPFLQYNLPALIATLLLFAVAVAGAAACYLRRRDRAAFRLISLACLAFVVGCLWSL